MYNFQVCKIMEKFRLIIIGASCMVLLITVALINLTHLSIDTLLKTQTAAALIMITFILIHFMLEEKDAGS